MKQNESSKESATKTRRAIIDLLKQRGGMDVLKLASEFTLSGMAIRKQLNALEEEGIVTSIEEARPMGRPAKLWVLTPEANQFFPSGYSELSISLIDSMKEAFGPSGLDKLLDVRNKKNAAAVFRANRRKPGLEGAAREAGVYTLTGGLYGGGAGSGGWQFPAGGKALSHLRCGHCLLATLQK